jgi:hypothetical protein
LFRGVNGFFVILCLDFRLCLLTIAVSFSVLFSSTHKTSSHSNRFANLLVTDAFQFAGQTHSLEEAEDAEGLQVPTVWSAASMSEPEE